MTQEHKDLFREDFDAERAEKYSVEKRPEKRIIFLGLLEEIAEKEPERFETLVAAAKMRKSLRENSEAAKARAAARKKAKAAKKAAEWELEMLSVT